MWNTKGLVKEEREGKICAGTPILSLCAPTGLAVPTEPPSRARPSPASCMCLPGWKPAVTEQSQVHSQDSGGTPCKDASLKGCRFAQETCCYKQGVCTIFALMHFCVVLCSPWWLGLHIRRSLHKGSTRTFVFISVFTVFRNTGVSPYLHWDFTDFFLCSSYSLSELYVSPP